MTTPKTKSIRQRILKLFLNSTIIISHITPKTKSIRQRRVGQAFACYDPITSWLRLNVTGSDPCYVQSDGSDATWITVDLAGFRRWIVNWPCVGAVSAALAG